MPLALLLALRVLWLLSAAPAQEPAEGEPGVLALVDVHVVSMETAEVLEHRTVLIRGDRIAAVGPVAELAVPAGAKRIDARGAYLTPGLIDLHVHLQDEVDAELFVLNGVTTVRECNGSAWSIWQRDAIARGEQLGPGVRVSSPPIIGFGHGLYGDELRAAARALVREQLEHGYEFLKLYDDITVDGYAALIEASRELGLRPIGHIPRNLTLEQVLRTPPDSIAHAEELLYAHFSPALDSAAIPEVTARLRESELAVVATLVTYDHIRRQVADLASEFARDEARYASALQRRDWGPERNRHRHFEKSAVPRFDTAFAFQKEFLRSFHEAGVPVLLGTDAGGAGIPFVFPGFSAHEELQHLVDVGLTPYEAIAAGTREAARYLGALDEVGTVTAGKRADLILSRENPLEDVRHLARAAGVLIGGRWLGPEEVRARFERISEQNLREVEFVRAVREGGASAAREEIERSLAAEPSILPFREWTLSELGYEALKLTRDLDLAEELFELNLHYHPKSWTAFEALAELHEERGDAAAALRCYRESLERFELNPECARRIAELQRELERE